MGTLGKDKDDYIIKNYYDFKNKELAEKIGVSQWYVEKVIKDNNIKPKGKGNYFKPFDVNKFNTSDGQYMIGYLLGDGSVQYNKEKRRCYITVTTIDLEFAEFFIKFFGRGTIYNKKGYKNKTYSVNFNSKEVVHYLISIGVTPLKANTCKLNIPYNADILRGYFDADGFVRKCGRDAKITSNSLKSLEDVKNFLGFGRITKRKNSNTNDFYISGSNAKKFRDIIYNNKEGFCLSRKKRRFYGNEAK